MKCLLSIQKPSTLSFLLFLFLLRVCYLVYYIQIGAIHNQRELKKGCHYVQFTKPFQQWLLVFFPRCSAHHYSLSLFYFICCCWCYCYCCCLLLLLNFLKKKFLLWYNFILMFILNSFLVCLFFLSRYSYYYYFLRHFIIALHTSLRSLPYNQINRQWTIFR